MNWSEEEYQDFLKRKGIEPPPKRKGPKQSKYSNKKTTIDGITFDSKKEAHYYLDLKRLKAAGEIKDFGLQPKYELQPKFTKNGKTYKPINYYADFIVDHNDGTTEIIDIKGMETKTFSMKKKMFEYKYQDLKLRIIK
jgi:hypothetical protein